jgi:hypothetical protein
MQANTQAPRAITDAEWAELASLPTIREAYGFEPSDAGADLARCSYGAHFNFVSGAPGYIGDVYVLFGDSLGQPMTLKRGLNGRLEEIRSDHVGSL